MIYCPRCDKPIAPDHRCLSRRWFLGMLGVAAVAPILPVPAAFTKGDTLRVQWVQSTPPTQGYYILGVERGKWRLQHVPDTGALSPGSLVIHDTILGRIEVVP